MVKHTGISLLSHAVMIMVQILFNFRSINGKSFQGGPTSQEHQDIAGRHITSKVDVKVKKLVI